MKSRKEVNHSYYVRKIKPFRKNKGVAEVPKIKCPLCHRFINLDKFVEREPKLTIDIRMWYYGGRANIIVQSSGETPEKYKEFLKNVLQVKFQKILNSLNAELGLIKGIIETSIGTQPYIINNNSNVETYLKSNVESQLNLPMEVKYGY
jgi:hypothetical protein